MWDWLGSFERPPKAKFKVSAGSCSFLGGSKKELMEVVCRTEFLMVVGLRVPLLCWL